MDELRNRLNYHHLHYFWAVAREGQLTRAAERLGVAQSALSTQIRQLERQLGRRLFTRQGRRLELTEAGRIALDHAETIFANGAELVATLRGGSRPERQALRIGAVATLSRNFQESFLQPLLSRPDVTLLLASGSHAELLTHLGAHALDLVLTNQRVQETAAHDWRCRLIARQSISLVGPPRPKRPFRYPEELSEVPLLLPSRGSGIRTGFDLICERHGLTVSVMAEVDDMALLRLLARDTGGVAVVPPVVVRDELREGTLEDYGTIPGLFEPFFAVSVRRQFQHPLLKSLLQRGADEVLDPDPIAQGG